MRKIVAAAALAAMVIAWPVAGTANDHGHSHDHDHDHHGHHHTAPHDGTLVVLGDESAHLELVLDPAKGHLTGYVLDGEAEKSIRIKQPAIALEISGGDVKSSASVELKAVANPLTGEKVGETSQFEGSATSLKNTKRFNVKLKTITIKGVEFKDVTSPFPEGNH